MTAEQQGVATAPGTGTRLEVLRLGTSDIYVPSAVVRAINKDGDLASLYRDDDGGLRVHVANQAPQDKPLARTSLDQLRVNVDNQATVILAGTYSPAQAASTFSYPVPYGSGAQLSMDAREQQAEISRQSAQNTRRRWVIT